MIPPSPHQHNSTVPHDHKLVGAHSPRTQGSAMSIHSNQSGSRMSCNGYDVPVMPASIPEIWGSSSGNPPEPIRTRSLYSCIPLPPQSHIDPSIHPLLERGMNPRIDYDVRMHPSTARNRRDVTGDDRWHYEAAVNPSLGSLTIRLALVERPIVVFPANLHHGIITVHDVLLAIHSAVCTSLLEVRNRRHRRHGALWASPPPRGYGGSELNVAEAQIVWPAGCYRWVGLTPSPTERDVWILITA